MTVYKSILAIDNTKVTSGFEKSVNLHYLISLFRELVYLCAFLHVKLNYDLRLVTEQA